MSQRFILHANDDGRALVKSNLHAFIDRLPEDKAWECVIDKHVKTRTAKQRRTLFGAAYGPIMDFMGLQGSDDKRDLHTFFCRDFFGERMDSLGRMVPIRTTTRNERGERDEISTIVALEIYAFIQRRAAEQGIDVPDPDPFWKEKAQQESENA
jgi:hypothetical protein